MAYTVMSYSSYAGDGRGGLYQWHLGLCPVSHDPRHCNDPASLRCQLRNTGWQHRLFLECPTGEKFINGVGQGAPGGNKVFETIWDGGGRDTIDLSNYASKLTIDLAPGGWINFGNSQVANLGAGQTAPGNVAMSLLFEGDQRSLIENAIGGSGTI